MNSSISYMKPLPRIKKEFHKYLWVTMVLAFVIVATNIETYLVFQSTPGSRATVVIFFLFYCEEFIFLLMSYLWIFPSVKSRIQKPFVVFLIFLSWLMSAAILSVLMKVIIYHIHDRSLGWHELWVSYLNALYRHFILLMSFGGIYVFGLWLKERIISMRNQNLVTELRHKNLQLQSCLLGAQMNPHLLVNVLNAIQGNIMEKSPESYYLITGIADIQEHLLTKSNIEQKTTLADEIRLIQKVLDLYSDLGKKLGHYHLLVNAPTDQIPFPANLLVPLFENIFKHGDLSDSNDLPVVNLRIQSSFLELRIDNKALPRTTSQHRASFGIRNCIKRLDTFFSNSYKFTAFTNGQRYQLFLEIKLKNYD